jgi:fructoselysine-6-P-deglycase FrlB-like protein
MCQALSIIARFISSDSGSTEEVLSVYQEVKKRGAKIIAIAAKEDNKLQRLIAKDNPSLLIRAKG